jgi:Fur family transcriptional regulator, stress-responsive regulator
MTPDATSPSPGQLLREAGLRVTRPRLAVLGALREHPHAGADTVLGVVRRDLGTVSTQAVYDVLNVLAERGVARRIQPAGSVALYELRAGDNHHHVVCRVCGAVSDVDCATGHAPCLDASANQGFVIDEAEVTYWGTCPDCQTRAPHRTSAATQQGVSNA